MTTEENDQPLNSNLTSDKKPKTGIKKFLSKKAQLLAIAGFAAFFILLIIYLYQTSGSDKAHKEALIGYNQTYPLTKPIRTGSAITFRIGLITDLDKNSINANQKNTYKAYIKRGYLSYNPTNNHIEIKWDQETTDNEPQTLINGYNYKGRGLELSELVTFNGKLLTVDDKTGLVFEVVNQNELVPWLILADGDGSSSQGFKAEWATVKDDNLYIGSHGKERNLPDGGMGSLSMMYVKVVTPQGQITHLNWVNEYRRLREAANITWPGYMLHESAVWSDVHSRWFFLPRKCTAEPYDTNKYDELGCDLLLSADANLFDIKVIPLNVSPDLGYSSFKFVPTSNDQVIVAIRTKELNDETATYISAFTVTGQILLNDTEISDLKYEGLEFL